MHGTTHLYFVHHSGTAREGDPIGRTASPQQASDDPRLAQRSLETLARCELHAP